MCLNRIDIALECGSPRISFINLRLSKLTLVEEQSYSSYCMVAMDDAIRDENLDALIQYYYNCIILLRYT